MSKYSKNITNYIHSQQLTTQCTISTHNELHSNIDKNIPISYNDIMQIEKKKRRKIIHEVKPHATQLTLDEYLYDSDLTLKEFAESIGYGYGYVSQCKNGVVKMSNRMKFLIRKHTNGKVIL